MADQRHLTLIDDALRSLFAYDSEIQSIADNSVPYEKMSPRQKAYIDLEIHMTNGQMAVVFTDTELVTMNELDANAEQIKDQLPEKE